MDGFNIANRRLDAVCELAMQEAQRAGLDPRRVLWVVQAARTELVRGGSAWRAIRVASEYAVRLAGEAA
jgi:hypothetical protein